MTNQRIGLIYALASSAIYCAIEIYTGSSYSFVACVLGSFIGARYGRCDWGVHRKLVVACSLTALSFILAHFSTAIYGANIALSKHNTSWVEILRNGAGPQLILAAFQTHQWLYTILGSACCALAVRVSHAKPATESDPPLIQL